MNRKLILLTAATFAVIGYSFADTTVTGTTVTTSGATVTESGASVTANSDADLEALLGSDASSGTETSGGTAAPTATAAAWGYADADTLTVTSTATGIVIKSPVVKDATGNPILTYVVKYSTKSMSAKIDSLEGAAVPQEKSFTYVMSGGILVPADNSMSGSATELTMNIDVAQGSYYIIITPKNAESVEGNPSKEANVTVGEAIPADHAAAGGESAAINGDISVNSGAATVTWATSIAGATKMQVFAKFAGDADYKKLSDVDVSKGTFSFDVQANKDFLVKLIAVDNAGTQVGAEQILTGKGDVSINAPKVGPASTLLVAVLMLSVIVYVTYRVRKINK